MAAKGIQAQNNRGQRSVQRVNTARISQAGVNTDEEMTPMVEYQKSHMTRICPRS
jgi:flagellar hook-associated protein FlgK